MKTNRKKLYISIENRVYSITLAQNAKFMDIIDQVTQENNMWHEGLQYIEKVGKLELEIDHIFRY